MYYDVLKEKVKYLKDSVGGRKKTCEIFEELKEQGYLSDEIIDIIEKTTSDKLNKLIISIFDIENEQDILQIIY